MNFSLLKQNVIKKLLTEKEKEYLCHVQFVCQIGLELAKKYKVNRKLIEISCLLHDIGRSQEIGDEDHADAGARISRPILDGTFFSKSEIETILLCIKNHNKHISNPSIEEKIVITADCASKVLFHEAFMLLCKKETYKEKLEWGQKYLEKGYKNIPLPEYKSKVRLKYNTIKEIYDQIAAS